LDVEQKMRITIQQLRRELILPVVLVIMLAIFPLIGVPRSWLLYLFMFSIYLAIANMWNLLAGYSGLISLCQPAFIGLSGYTMVILTWVGIPYYLGIIAGAIVAAAFAMLISIPVFRLRGIYFAIGTLVVPEALRIVFFLWRPVGGELAGGGAGYMLKGTGGVTTTEIYWLALVIGVASVLVMRIILRSRLGLGLAAIRDNDRTAASSGVDVFRLKLYSFVIGALVTGIAGAIFYIYQGYIEPASAFNIRWTMILMLATVIGGVSTEEGPIVGTVIVVFLHFLLAKQGALSLLIQGVVLVGIMLLAPQGIMGFIRKTRPYHSLLQLATRR
jgi:branched-chain amino acid transport system permease protein